MRIVVVAFLYLYFSLNLFAQELYFSERSNDFGIRYYHSFTNQIDPMPLRVSAGVAVGDINNDGKDDLFYVLGDSIVGVLLLNDGNGQFVEITLEKDETNRFRGSGPLFFNYNQDEFIDLIIGSVDGTPPVIYRNNGDLTFSRLASPEFDALTGINTPTITSVDYNKDGLDDLFFSHWLEEYGKNHFWKNLGNGHFKCVDVELGFYNPFGSKDFMHSSNFCDINGDKYPDLLLCSDFGTSQVWINRQGEKFMLDTMNHLGDENAMGSTVGDFDNDGDFDWFMTSIYDGDGVFEGNWGGKGNRLYLNDGFGRFEESAELFGVNDASWAWGTTFGDLDSDGFLDIIAVNGWPQGSPQFRNDSVKIFMSHDALFFSEESEHFNVIDTLQGRGVSCVDYDNDGDLDIAISNYRGPIELWENLSNHHNSFLDVRVWESKKNSFGFGTILKLYAGKSVQTRYIHAGSNYLSQSSAEVHFGLGQLDVVDSIIVEWKDNTVQKLYHVAVNQKLVIRKITEKVDKTIQQLAYPNPTENLINFEFYTATELGEKAFFEIINIQGFSLKRIHRSSWYGNCIKFSDVDVSDLENGVFLGLLRNSNNEILGSTKFLKY